MSVRIRAAALGLALAVAGAVAGAPAQAATVVESHGFNIANAAVDHPVHTGTVGRDAVDDTMLGFAAFDTGLGVLTGAHLTIAGAQTFTAGVSVAQPDGAAYSEGGGGGGYQSRVFFAGFALGEVDGQSGVLNCVPQNQFCDAVSTQTQPYSLEVGFNDLTAFLAGGPLAADFSSTASIQGLVYVGANGSTPTVTYLSELDWSGEATLTYVYDPATVVPPAAVPEPGAWSLMLLGFGGMGAALRGRRARRAAAAA